MNNQEAIEIMKDELKCYTGECQKRCYECNVPTNEDIAIAYKMAIAALEKQEPVKPEHHTCGAGDYYSCPKCGNRGVNDYYGYYCDNCGQLLGWKRRTQK